MKCQGWRRECESEATMWYISVTSKERCDVCDACYQSREDEREDADAQSREHDRKLREELAALPPNEINPATGANQVKYDNV